MSSRSELSPEQLTVVQSWGQGMAVMAGAGSGKTTTLVAKCVKLMELNSKARFAAVSFTERSASDLRSKLSTRLLESRFGSLQSHWVATIHGLCGSVIREYPREAGLNGEETVLNEAEAQLLWEQAIEALWVESLSEDLRLSLERLLDREGQSGLADLLKRVRDLSPMGVLRFLTQSDDESSHDLEKIAQAVLYRYERLKRRQGSIDFNDLETGADRALDHEQVRQAYHRRFDLVLVDEFQDTNPIQARIIWKFARPDASNLCVVGDPKQSIYRFRDADVTVFEEHCGRLPLHQSLTWNFRSLPGIIEFANQICHPAFVASHMTFEALVPMREQKSDQQAVVRLDLKNPEELGDWIASEVQRGFPLHDFALLLRKIRGNEKWIKALTSRGIPIAIGSGGLFWEDPRIRELVSFLRWWDNPAHSLSGAIFLRAPWMGIPDLVLDEWSQSDPTWMKPFFSSQHPVAMELKPYLNRVARPAELLSALLVNEEIENELGAQWMGLWHRVEEYSAQGLDFHSVVVELSRAIQEKRREKDVPAPKNLGQLSVLTIHGSKGLEFPHVILVDLGDKPRGSDTPLLFWDRKQGVYLGKRDSNGERDRKSATEAQWRELERLKNLAESKRLFYVALTRARESLILVCPELKATSLPPKTEEVWNHDYWRAWVEASGSEISRVRLTDTRALGGLKTEAKIIRSKIAALPQDFKPGFKRVRHSVTEWTLLSRCPRAYEWTFIRPPAVIPEKSGDPTEEVSYQELGTRVHGLLERSDWEGLRKLEEEVGVQRFSSEPVKQWAVKSPVMAPPNPEKGRDVWSELSFEVPLRGEILVGSIDRLVLEEKKGKPCYSIVDFKVSEKPKSFRALTAAYQTQLELYAWALTALDPKIRMENVSAVLVNISSTAIQTVPVYLGKMKLHTLLDDAIRIINGEEGMPKPSFQCQYCDYRKHCPDAEKIKEPGDDLSCSPI